MYKVRQWSVNHARMLELLYRVFEAVFVRLHPLWQRIGYQQVEKPIRMIEKVVKGLMFDCQMCGQCALSSTGMSCPMNCPKTIRNGPCGGVRPNGHCEVKPEMRCVWVDAWRGSQNMRATEAIHQIQVPVHFDYQGSSSWLRVTHERNDAKQDQMSA